MSPGVPLFPVTMVGSWPRPAELLRAQKEKRAGNLAPAEFDRRADAAVLETLRIQEEAGVDVVTDGEQRRDNFYSFVAEKLDGVKLMTLAEMLDIIEDKAGFEQILTTLDVPAYSLSNPTCVGRIERRAPLALEELRFVKRHTSRPVKIPLPGPYLLTRAMFVKEASRPTYASKEELSVDVVRVLRAEMTDLVREGADFIQFDEPVLTEVVFGGGKTRTFMCASLAAGGDPDEELEFAVTLLNQVLEGFEHVQTGLHICRGNWSQDESTLLSGSYAPLKPWLERMNVRQLVLEYATSRAGDLMPFEVKQLGLGCVNPRTIQIETEAEVIAQVERALAHYAPEQIWLNPDCGFGTFSNSPVNSGAIAAEKMRVLAGAARTMRERHKKSRRCGTGQDHRRRNDMSNPWKLDKEGEALFAKADKIARDVVGPAAAELDEKAMFPKAAMRAMREAGLLGLVIGKKLGGHGQGLRAAAAICERYARECPSTAMVTKMHFCGSAVIEACGNEALRSSIAQGGRTTTLAFSEYASRSHFWLPQSTAEKRANGIALNAAKQLITSAGECDIYVWSSKPASAEGLSTIWAVPVDAAGISIPKPYAGMGLRGNASAPITAKDVIIPEDNRLGEDGKGFDVMMGAVMPYFSLQNCAVSLGSMEGAIDRAIKHVTNTGYAYDKSKIADLPQVRQHVAKMRCKADMVRGFLLDALDAIENKREDAVLRVLQAKVIGAETSLEVHDLAMRICGGAAYRKEVGVERFFRDSRAATVMAPVSDALYEFIGKAVCGMPVF